MFVNEDYENYRYLVSASDNYYILTNSRYIDGSFDSPDEINIIYQYIKPSFLTIPSTYTSYRYEEFTRVDNLTSDFKERGDYIDIIIGCTIVVILAMFIFKQVTRLFVKGGV